MIHVVTGQDTMPSAIKSVCQCGGIKTKGVCDRCGTPRKQDRTGTGQVYGGRWKRQSEKRRKRQPWCTACFADERVTTAEAKTPLHSHHVVPVLVAPELRDDEDNIIVLCQRCHVEVDNLYRSNRREYDMRMARLKTLRDSF